MFKLPTRNHLPFLVGLMVATCSLMGVGAASGEEPSQQAPLLPQFDEPLLAPTMEEPGTAGVADADQPIEVIQERYPNGKVKIRREMTQDEQENYILHGQWEMWDEQGALVGSGEYHNNERQGKWTRLHTGKEAALFGELPYKQFTAPFTSQATFKDGKLEGTWVISDSEGRIVSEWEFSDGVRHGLSVWNYPSGQKMKEITFKDGLIDGYARAYDVESTLVEDSTFKNGQKIALKVEHDKSGRKVEEAMYLHAQLVIDTEADWWSAKPATYKAIGEDVKHGRAIGWFPNGQVRVDGHYDKGLPDGEFTWWFANGQKEVTGSYRVGLEHGEWVWWHENGQKAMKGEKTAGEATGEWYRWETDGRLVEKTDFSAIDSIASQSEPTIDATIDATDDSVGDAPALMSQNPEAGSILK